MTVRQWLDIHAIYVETWTGPLEKKKRPVKTAPGLTQKYEGIEIHKKTDQKEGDVVIIFKVLNPDEPRGKHVRKQISSLVVDCVGEDVECEGAVESNLRNLRKHRARTNARAVMMHVMQEAIKHGPDADGELNSKRDAMIHDLNLNVSMKHPPTRKRSNAESAGQAAKQPKAKAAPKPRAAVHVEPPSQSQTEQGHQMPRRQTEQGQTEQGIQMSQPVPQNVMQATGVEQQGVSAMQPSARAEIEDAWRILAGLGDL